MKWEASWTNFCHYNSNNIHLYESKLPDDDDGTLYDKAMMARMVAFAITIHRMRSASDQYIC